MKFKMAATAGLSLKEKIMRSLFLASTSWLENVCYLAKEIINAKIV
jgi:hypothetical protein